MDNLKSGQAHQRLHVPMTQVNWNVAIVDAFQESVENGCGHCRIALIAVIGIQTGSITGNAEDLPIQGGDNAARLGGMGLLHRSCRTVDIGDASLCVIIVRYDILQLGLVVLRTMTTRTIILYRRHGGTVATGMVEGLVVHEHVGSMGRPVHLQTRQEPVRLFFHLCQPHICLLLQAVILLTAHLLSR